MNDVLVIITASSLGFTLGVVSTHFIARAQMARANRTAKRALDFAHLVAKVVGPRG